MIRCELADALDEKDNLARLILKLYEEYAHGVTVHMRYEEKHVFPYVQKLLDGETSDNYDIDTYSKHHNQLDTKLRELKNIIIKYLPADGPHNNKLMATLYDIYNNEEWLGVAPSPLQCGERHLHSCHPTSRKPAEATECGAQRHPRHGETRG